MKSTLYGALVLCSCNLAWAQENPQDSCGKIMEYFSGGDVDGALEEARWCVEALEQLKQGQESTFFRDDVGGWKRMSLEQNKAMGFAMTEASYAKDAKEITVSLIGGAGGANSLGGLLGSIAQAGIAASGSRMRIQQHAAVASTDAGTNQLMITLESGGQLQISSTNASLDEVKAFAEQFPITELDEARR